MNAEILALSARLGGLLQARGERVTTAESCTGGLLAGAITAVAGSSAWFHGSVVAYDNAVKAALLGVSAQTLQEHGAVSEATVRQMAGGALTAMRASWAMAVSGIAGPGGGLPGKPVGTVWFGLAHQAPGGGLVTQAVVQHFAGDRAQVREQCVGFGLAWLIQAIEAEPMLA